MRSKRDEEDSMQQITLAVNAFNAGSGEFAPQGTDMAFDGIDGDGPAVGIVPKQVYNRFVPHTPAVMFDQYP